MKKLAPILATTLILFFSTCYAADFIHPLDFGGTSEEKEAVVSFIIEQTKASCDSIGINDPATIKMMEKQNLAAFKTLTTAKNREILDIVINQCKTIGIRDYSTIQMMYNQQLQAFV